MPGDGGKVVFVKGATYNGCFWETLLHGEDGLAFNLGNGDNGGDSSYKNIHVLDIVDKKHIHHSCQPSSESN